MPWTWLGKFEEWLIGAILAVMTLITFGQVIARYVFNYSFVWALELVTYLFAWLIFLGMAYGVRVGAHIGIDALVKSLKPGPARVAGAVAALLCVAYSLIGLLAATVYVKKIYDVGIMAEDLPIEQWIPRLVLPIGFALLAVRFGETFYRIVTGRERGLHLADEAAEALRLRAEDPAGSGKQP